MTQAEQLEYLCTQVNELAARARRTETQLHKVREHLGIAPVYEKVLITDHNTVTVGGFDVTLSQIKRALEEDLIGHEMLDTIQVHNRAGLIATITFRG